MPRFRSELSKLCPICNIRPRDVYFDTEGNLSAYKSRCKVCIRPKHTHCRKGLHLLSKDNLLLDKNGRPRCKACVRLKSLRIYGINSFEERNSILKSQGNACAICRCTDCDWHMENLHKRWCIDHDHNKPGTFRGVLCGKCNVNLGRIEKYMQNILNYLKHGKDYCADREK
jgi:hypothetical protein